MTRNLLITVRLHDWRYHGMGEWRPSPARLFQALVAGVARGNLIDDESISALNWLENLSPPIIGLPPMRQGIRFTQFGPDNDIDTVGNDLTRVDEIRSSKAIEPKLFNYGIPFLFVWSYQEGKNCAREAKKVCSLAKRLYQFGRGVDMAWARGEVLDSDRLEAVLLSYLGTVYRPTKGDDGKRLPCPEPGTLKRLMDRYAAGSRRFRTVGAGNAARQLFSQPPKPRFVQVPYDSPVSRQLYDLREITPEASFGSWPLADASGLVTIVRDIAAGRLRDVLTARSSEVERVIIGRKADGSDDSPTGLRIRIIPLLSIGHYHADRQIRRVLVEVPPGCPFRADDIFWAFSGLELIDRNTGEILDLRLTPATDDSMLRHYGVADRVRSSIWRTVTPVALPESAKRRRIDPANLAAEVKDGAERVKEQGRAAAAVVQALRHAEVRAQAHTIRVQQEPFESNGERVELFSKGTRFAKERLWHVEIVFCESIAGPLVIGDGRFLGLGVMAPLQTNTGILAYVIEDGLTKNAEPTEVTRALRRAVMARAQEVLGARSRLPTFFTGHERDGSAAKSERHPHLTFVFDPARDRLLILAPHIVDRRVPTRQEIRYLETLDKAMTEFRELRAGAAGSLTLQQTSIDAGVDLLFGVSRVWECVTPYQVTRHVKKAQAADVLSANLRAECRRLGLPEPLVTSSDLCGVSGVGLVGSARLTFAVAVNGPILLGKNRHLGGGLFARNRRGES